MLGCAASPSEPSSTITSAKISPTNAGFEVSGYAEDGALTSVHASELTLDGAPAARSTFARPTGDVQCYICACEDGKCLCTRVPCDG
jgi:hypothetical protein